MGRISNERANRIYYEAKKLKASMTEEDKAKRKEAQRYAPSGTSGRSAETTSTASTSSPKANAKYVPMDTADNQYAQALAAFNPGGTFVPRAAQEEIAARKAANRSRYMDALDTSTRAGVAAAGSGTVRPVMNTDETVAVRNEWAKKAAQYEADRQSAGREFRSARGSDEYRDRVGSFDSSAIPYGANNTGRIRYALDDSFRNELDTFNQRQGLRDSTYENLKYLNDFEKNDLKNLVAQGDYERANKYLDHLQPELNARMQGNVSAANKKLAEEQPVAGVLANIVGTREAGMALLPTIQGAINEEMGVYKPVDTNGSAFRAAHLLRDTEEGIGNAAYNAAGGGTKGEIARTLAQAGLSAAQNASMLPMGGTAPLVFMGSMAAGQSALDTLENGGTAQDALKVAVATGIIEAATEKIGIDNFFRISRLGSKGIKDFLKGAKQYKLLANDIGTFSKALGSQMGAEGVEEMIAEVAGNLADTAIRGDNGQYAQLVQTYMANGMSEEQAKARAFTDMYIDNVAKAGITGALAGGMLGAGGATIGTYQTSARNRELVRSFESVGNELQNLNITPEQLISAVQQSGSRDAQDFARELSQKLALGEEVTTAEMGRLHLLSNNYITSKDYEAVQKAAIAEEEEARNAGGNVRESEQNLRGSEAAAGVQQNDGNAAGVQQGESLQKPQNQPVGTQTATKAQTGAIDVASKATDNTESIEPTTGQVTGEAPQTTENAPEEARQPMTYEQGTQVQTPQGEGTVVMTADNTVAVRLANGTTEIFKTADLSSAQANANTALPQSANAQTATGNTAANAETNEANAEVQSKTAAQTKTVAETSWENIQKIVQTKAKGGLSQKDEYTMNSAGRRAFDRIGRALGVEIHFVDRIVNEEGEANGLYQNGHIFIARNAENPYHVVLAHEITHHFEKTAPDVYEKFKGAALKMNPGLVEKYMARWGYGEAVAEFEVAADFAGELLEKEGTVKRVIKEDISAARGFHRAMNAVFDKVRGDETKGLTEEEKKLDAQLDAARDMWRRCLRETRDEKAEGGESKGQFSRKLPTAQSIEDELNASDIHRTSSKNEKNRARIDKYLSEHYPNLYVDYINYRSTGEVKVKEVMTKAEFRARQEEHGRKDEELRKHREAVGRFQKRIRTPSGRKNLIQSIENHLKRDNFDDATVRSSRSMVRTMSFYVEGYGITIKVSDHFTGFQQAQYPGEFFVNTDSMANIAEVYKPIKRFMTAAKELYAEDEDIDTDAVAKRAREMREEKVKQTAPQMSRKLTPEQRKLDADYMAAVERGDMETAQRMVDEAAKAAGYNVKVYHGTLQEMQSAARGRLTGKEYDQLERNYADKLFPFVVFRPGMAHAGIYTATDRGVSEDFAFSFSHGGTVFELYAKTKHPLVVDAGGKGWNNIPRDAADAVGLTEEILKDLDSYKKTRNKNNIYIDDLVEYAKKKGHDGVVVENVRETGFGDEDSPITTDVIVFNPNQIKSADPVTYDDNGNVIPLSERFNEKNPDIRFSMKKPVEYTKNLVALHNLSSDKLGKTLDLGGFPMPSIAVTKDDIPHTNFGDISLVMKRETIDPKANNRNTVYSADAWTPVFPQVEYEADEEKATKLLRKYSDLTKRFGRETADALYPWGNYADDQLNRVGGEAAAIERYRDDTDMMKVFLADTKGKVPEPVTKETVTRLSDDQIRLYDHIISELGRGAVYAIKSGDFENPLQRRKKWFEKYGDRMKAAYKSYLTELGLSDEEADNAVSQETRGSLTRHVLAAWRYMENGPETTKTERDFEGTREAIRKATNKKAYETWLKDTFGGIEKASGLYNYKERYTPGGNLRSFAATHYPVTLENIVKAMRSENGGNTKNVSGFHGVKTLRAGTAVRFKSVEHMHELERRLQHLTEEEAEQINNALAERLATVINEISGTRKPGRVDNAFLRMDEIGETLEEIAESGKYTLTDIRKTFEKYRYPITTEIAQDVKALLFDISEMPVNIFEAKPERVVGFDEVLAAVVPSDIDAGLKRRIEDAGMRTIEYEAGSDESRLAAVNSVEGAKFSRKRGVKTDLTLTQDEINDIQSIGEKSVNSFTSAEIKTVDRLAKQCWRDLGAKSPFFRAWFGDWRADDKKTKVNIAKEKGTSRNPIYNVDTAWTIQVSGKVFSETRHQMGRKMRIAVPYLAYIDSIVKNAILLDTYGIKVGKEKSPNSLLMHSLYAVVDIGNGPAVVKLFVEEMNDPNIDGTAKRAYQLQGIEIQQPSAKVQAQGALASSQAVAAIKNVADLFAFVKKFDPDFKPKPASKVVNVDGTPKVVYHGTKSKFTVFNRGEKNGWLGKSIYFAESKEYAKENGKRVVVAYLRATNPFMVKGDSPSNVLSEIRRKFPEADDYNMTEILSANGYDAINFNHWDKGEIIGVFSPEQIKSATDNVGTFDRSNPDIRFSRKGQDAAMRRANRLARENARLKGQFKLTKGVKLRESDIRKVTRDLLKDYEIIDFDKDELERHIRAMAEAAQAADESNADKTWDSIRNVARGLSRYVGRAAFARYADVDEEYDADLVRETYEDIRRHLGRQRVLNPWFKDPWVENESPQRKEMRDYYRRKLFGVLTLTSDRSVDKGPLSDIGKLYEELTETFGEAYFPSDVTNDEDQTIRIADVLDDLKDTLTMIGERTPVTVAEDVEQSSRDETRRAAYEDEVYGELYARLEEDILNRIAEVRREKPTFADKKKAEQYAAVERAIEQTQSKAEAAEIANRIEDARKYRERIAKLEARLNKLKEENKGLKGEARQTQKDIREADTYYRQAAQEALREAKAQKREALQELKDKYKAKTAEARERQRARELRKKIEKYTKDLYKTLAKPTNEKHINEDVRPAAALLISLINQESSFETDPATGKRVSRGGTTRQAQLAGMGLDIDLPNILTKRTEAARKMKKAAEQIFSGEDNYLLIYDPELMENLAIMEDWADKPLAAMSSAELQVVWDAVRGVEHMVTQSRKVFNEGRQWEIGTLASGLVRDVDLNNPRRTIKYGAAASVDKLLNIDQLTPQAFFHRFGEGGDRLFRMLRRSQDKYVRIIADIQARTAEVIKDIDIDKLNKDIATYKVKGGDVTLSRAQVLLLYASIKREQAAGHILGGGIKAKPLKGKGLFETKQLLPVEVTQEDLDNMFKEAKLTEAEKKAADGLVNIMSTVLAEYGNEASLRTYGYAKFREGWYVPIETDPTSNKTDNNDPLFKQFTAAASIAGRGFAKQTKEGSKNAIMVGSLFDVYAKHVNDMAMYAAYVETLENMRRVRNFKFEDGTKTQNYIEALLTQSGVAYWDKLINDINGGERLKSDDFSFERFVGAYKAAAVSANIRVILQQPTAIIRAAAEINPAYLIAAMRKIPKRHEWDRVKKNSAIAQWKDWGYFDINTGRQMRDVVLGTDSLFEKFKQAGMRPMSGADSFAWTLLYHACEDEAKAKGLRPGSAAFDSFVASRFSDIIDKTQVVDGVLQRSQIMRSTNAVTKMATSFMAEPTKTYNMFLSAVWDFRHARSKTEKQAARKKLGFTVAALVVSFLVNAAAQSLIDALRDDDRDKDLLDKFLDAYLGRPEEDDKSKAVTVMSGNLWANFNPVTYIPFFKDIMSLVQGFDTKRMDMESIGRVINAAEQALAAARGEGKQTTLARALALASEVSRVFGLPLANIKRDSVAVLNTIAQEKKDYGMMYNVDRAFYKLDKNVSRYVDIMLKAHDAGDTETEKRITDDLHAAGVDDKKIKSAADTIRKKQEGVDSVSDLKDRYRPYDEAAKYNKLESYAKGTSTYRQANTTERSKYEKMLEDALANNDTAQERHEKARGIGVSDNQYMELLIAADVADRTLQKNRDGSKNESQGNGSVTQDEYIAALEMTRLTREQKRKAFAAKWPKSKNNPYN